MIHNKLIRDDVVLTLQARKIPHGVGQVPVGSPEHLELLIAKLREEVEEFNEDRSSAELADIQEVVDAIAYHFIEGGSKTVAETQRIKREGAGGFNKGIVLIWS